MTTLPNPSLTHSRTTQAISSFLPRLLIGAINGGQINHQQKAFTESFEASLLFADISGFTALAERLEQQGQEGAEQLTLILNRCFGGFIERVQAHQGDVVKFAGDALLAVWRTDTHQDLKQVTTQAIQCGQALQNFMAAEFATGPVTLKMKVAVSAGPVNMACIGGLLNRRELVLSSPALAELGRANDHAQAGDLIVCESAQPCKAAPPSSASQSPANLTVVLTEEARPVGLEFIPAAIRQSLGAEQAEWINENRQVSVLFVNLGAFSNGLPIELTQQCMVAMQKALYTVEGSVNKISVDDKGVSLMGVLGMPPFSHLDDPERAVKAAALIHEALAPLGLNHQIGISTGTVFCGVVGNAMRREYTMMGDAVNLAARLMQHSSKLTDGLPILIDETTARACSPAIELKPQTPVQLKGKQTRLALFQLGVTGSVCEAPLTALTRTQSLAFVGRTHETEQLTVHLQQQPESAHKALLVRAPVGMGRRCLIQHSVQTFESARRDNLSSASRANRVIAHECQAMESQLPWSAWQPMFQTLLGLQPGGKAAVMIDAIKAQLAPEEALSEPSDHSMRTPQIAEMEGLWPLLEAVLPGHWPDTEQSASLTDQARAQATEALLCDLLLALHARDPVGLVFYSVEWMDSASSGLLLRLLEQAHCPPLILSRNSEALSNHLNTQPIEQSPSVRVLSLAPLSDGEITELIGARVGGKAIPEQASQLICERAGGSPLFALQAIEALLDEGWLIETDSDELQWQCPEGLSESALPNSINGLLLSRIDRLAPEIQLTGKVAAVMGLRAQFDQLAHLHPKQLCAVQLSQQTQALSARGLTAPSQATPATLNCLEFINEAVAQSFYKLLAGYQRRQLHRDLATWLESNDALDPNAPQIQAQRAFHWSRACHSQNNAPEAGVEASTEAAEKATALYLQLAERAIRLGASDEAESSYRNALDLCDSFTSPRLSEFGIEGLLGLSAVRSTRYGWADPQAEQALEKARGQITDHVASQAQGIKLFQAIRGLWQVKVAHSDYALAMDLADDLVALAEQNQTSEVYSRMRAEADRAVGTTHFWLGHFVASQVSLNAALNRLNEQTHSSITLAQDTEVSARGILAWAYALSDQEELALQQAEQAVVLSDALDSEFTRAYARGAAMWTGLHVSNVSQALHYAEQTLQLSRTNGYDYFTTAALVVRGWAKAWQGDASGLDDLHQAISDWRGKGQTIGVPAFLLQQVRALQKLGHHQEANDLLQDPLFVQTLPKEPWIVHLARKMVTGFEPAQGNGPLQS